MKKVMMVVFVVMGMQASALYASDYGDQQVDFGDVMQYPSNPYVFGTRDWYAYNKHRSADEASALSGRKRDSAGEYVAERARFLALSSAEQEAELAVLAAEEAAKVETAAEKAAAWERAAKKASEMAMETKLIELANAAAAVEMEQDSESAIARVPRKKMSTKVYEFVYGTPLQRAEKADRARRTAAAKELARLEAERSRLRYEQEDYNYNHRRFEQRERNERALGWSRSEPDAGRDVWGLYPYGRPTSTESPFGRGGK